MKKPFLVVESMQTEQNVHLHQMRSQQALPGIKNFFAAAVENDVEGGWGGGGTPGKKPVSMAESRPPAGLPPCFELELSGKPEEG